MLSFMRELAEGSILEIHMQERYGDVLRGEHVHLCPKCFEDVPCADCCTWDGESVTNADVPTCHPVICERCETASRLYHEQGGGI
jgi:hypothetical protein